MIDKLFREQRARVESAGIPGPTRVSLQLAAKVGPMAVRGALLAPRLRSAASAPLVGRGVRVRNPQFIDVGRNVLIEDGAEVQGLSRDGIRLGDDVSIGANVLIRPSSYYSRDIGVGLVMLDRSSISPQCYIGCSGGVVVEEDAMIGPGVRLFSENHVTAEVGASIKQQGVEWGPIVIGAGSWIASGVTITAGVRIGRGAVIGAGAVVTRDVPDGEKWAGIPARRLRGKSDDS